MPSLELAAGQVLTAAHTNTYWMRQVLAAQAVADRPTGYHGRAVYDTDTDALMIYNDVEWRPPWNLPWGELAEATSVDTASITTTFTVVSGLSITLDVPANRRIRVSARCAYYSTGDPRFAIFRGGVALNGNGWVENGGSGNFAMCVDFHIDEPPAGTITYDLRARAATGGITLANDQTVGFLVIEDIGPAGVPA